MGEVTLLYVCVYETRVVFNSARRCPLTQTPPRPADLTSTRAGLQLIFERFLVGSIFNFYAQSIAKGRIRAGQNVLLPQVKF